MRFARTNSQVVDDPSVAECRDREPKMLTISMRLGCFLEREQLDETEMCHFSSCKVHYSMFAVVLSYIRVVLHRLREKSRAPAYGKTGRTRPKTPVHAWPGSETLARRGFCGVLPMRGPGDLPSTL